LKNADEAAESVFLTPYRQPRSFFNDLLDKYPSRGQSLANLGC